MNVDAADLLLDTSVWIDWYRGRPESIPVRSIEKALEEDRVMTCGVILFELLRGARKKSDWGRIREDQFALRFLPLDVEQYESSALLSQEAGKRGFTMSLSDSLLAGLALRHGLLLVTKDGDFRHFPGLETLLIRT